MRSALKYWPAIINHTVLGTVLAEIRTRSLPAAWLPKHAQSVLCVEVLELAFT
jgi:hypothetical protein